MGITRTPSGRRPVYGHAIAPEQRPDGLSWTPKYVMMTRAPPVDIMHVGTSTETTRKDYTLGPSMSCNFVVFPTDEGVSLTITRARRGGGTP